MVCVYFWRDEPHSVCPCAYICFLAPVISRLACLRDIFLCVCRGNGVYDIIYSASSCTYTCGSFACMHILHSSSFPIYTVYVYVHYKVGGDNCL